MLTAMNRLGAALAAFVLAVGVLLGGCEMFPFAEQFRSRKRADQISTALSTMALAQGGRRELQAGNLDRALQMFMKALERDPNQLDAHVGIGDIHQVKGDYAQAALQYETARNISPRSFEVNYKLGLMYHLLNRLQEAVDTYLQALTINPNNFDANLNLATAYLQIEQPGLALPYADKAVQLSPESQAAYVNLGAIYSALNRHEDAVTAYRSALDRGDLSPPIAVNLVNALVKINAFDRAINALDVMIRQEQRHEFYERLGYVHFKAGAYEQSMAAYEKALELNPGDFASLNGLGVNLMTSYLKNGAKEPALRDQAIASWQRSVRLNSDQPKIVDLISRYKGI
jgi:tetratricopeptide (TPR) repeat protein